MRTEQRLFQAWREHRLINAINQVVFEVDDSGIWQFLNEPWSQLSGLAIEDTLGTYFGDSWHEEDVAQAEALLEAALRHEPAQATLRLRTASGESKWVTVDMRLSAPSHEMLPSVAGTLSDATEWKQTALALQEQVRALLARREQQVTFYTRVAREFASGKAIGQLYDWFVRELAATFEYDEVQLYEHDEVAEGMILVASSARETQHLVGGRVDGSSVERALQVALTKRMSVLQRAGDDPDWRLSPIVPQARGILATPLLLGDVLLGALVLYSEQATRLTEEDSLLLEGLAGQLGGAIDSNRLRLETEERMAELDNLQRLMGREAWLRAAKGGGDGVQGYRFDRRRMEAVESTDKGQLPDVSEAHSRTTGDETAKHVRPLEIRGQRFGTIGVEDDPQDPLTAADIQLLEAISQQVAEAMENARLLEQTQKRAVELETVARVSTATSTILDKDKLLQGVVELTKRSFDLYHAHIYLLDSESGGLVLAAGAGEAGRQMAKSDWRIDLDTPRSIVARAARERKGIIVNDVRKETGFLANPLLPATRAELAVPMISGNRLLGVLDVQADTVNYFTQDDVRIQSALAGQVATALQNAILYQEQLETAAKLREFDRLKSEFLASMSHELRTPLNSVIGFADVLLEGIDGQLNERMTEDVQLIRNSGQHLRDLIGDILDMSKIEAGMMDLRYEAIDLPAMRQEIDGFVRTQMMTYDKELAFHLSLAPEASVIEADRTRFKQVLFNLLSNAIKFTAQGSVTLAMSVEDDHLLMSVSDTGIGIKEENIPIIFEQFRQVDGSLTRTAGGTGLGLPISKSLIELHGGEIWVESKVGEGTTFHVTFPLKQPDRRRGQPQDLIARSNGSS